MDMATVRQHKKERKQWHSSDTIFSINHCGKTSAKVERTKVLCFLSFHVPLGFKRLRPIRIQRSGRNGCVYSSVCVCWCINCILRKKESSDIVTWIINAKLQSNFAIYNRDLHRNTGLSTWSCSTSLASVTEPTQSKNKGCFTVAHSPRQTPCCTSWSRSVEVRHCAAVAHCQLSNGCCLASVNHRNMREATTELISPTGRQHLTTKVPTSSKMWPVDIVNCCAG